MNESIILFGAGSIGRNTLRHLRDRGDQVLCFADNDTSKWGTTIDGCDVCAPGDLASLFPDATWVASAIRHPFGRELRAQMEQMGVRQKNLWNCLSAFPATGREQSTVGHLVGDSLSLDFYNDQIRFRQDLDCNLQLAPCEIADIYFPDFISRRDDEHFVDCGAADGDTVRAFIEHWPTFAHITALEPDAENYAKLTQSYADIYSAQLAVGDRDGWERFAAHHDCSSHFDSHGTEMVQCVRLDSMDFSTPPTFIKMDIEGAELDALWGAREIIRDYLPVLAICAYHTADHLWQIPLLIHALQPRYEIFLRRYAEGASELVWYAVPPERRCP
jgi:FkbM family methyltransferase